MGVTVFDLRLIPAQHLYRQGALGHDPEGLAAIVGALITMLVGVTAWRNPLWPWATTLCCSLSARTW